MSNRIHRITVITLAAVLSTAAAASTVRAGDAGEAPRSTREAVEAWNEAFEQAFAVGDVDAIAAMFTEDVEIVESLRPVVKGRDAVREYFRYYVEFGLEHLQSHTEEVLGDHETAVEIGRNTVRIGGLSEVTSRYMCLFRKVDGRWLAHRVVSNS